MPKAVFSPPAMKFPARQSGRYPNAVCHKSMANPRAVQLPAVIGKKASNAWANSTEYEPDQRDPKGGLPGSGHRKRKTAPHPNDDLSKYQYVNSLIAQHKVATQPPAPASRWPIAKPPRHQQRKLSNDSRYGAQPSHRDASLHSESVSHTGLAHNPLHVVQAVGTARYHRKYPRSTPTMHRQSLLATGQRNFLAFFPAIEFVKRRFLNLRNPPLGSPTLFLASKTLSLQITSPITRATRDKSNRPYSLPSETFVHGDGGSIAPTNLADHPFTKRNFLYQHLPTPCLNQPMPKHGAQALIDQGYGKTTTP
ncbi:MAG: hypothetical protein Q8R51_02470 [Azonexus sp.]|nr:hypothetical protein [Azonexus sp.]